MISIIMWKGNDLYEIYWRREKELKKLDKIIRSDEFSFALIYGRRRVGKSELIHQALSNCKERYIMNANKLQNKVMWLVYRIFCLKC